jgi:hypothetical protein
VRWDGALVNVGGVLAIVHEAFIAVSPRWPVLMVGVTAATAPFMVGPRRRRSSVPVVLDHDAHAELLEVDPVYAEIDAARCRAERAAFQARRRSLGWDRPSETELIEAMLMEAERQHADIRRRAAESIERSTG